MKSFIYLFIILALAISCEKDEEIPNPFVGMWETTETTEHATIVATIDFGIDMILTYSITTSFNDQSFTTSLDYTYSYTDTQITVQRDGEPAETTDYTISGNTLTLSIGGMDTRTYTKIN
jgi:hypothetical protein